MHGMHLEDIWASCGGQLALIWISVAHLGRLEPLKLLVIIWGFHMLIWGFTAGVIWRFIGACMRGLECINV